MGDSWSAPRPSPKRQVRVSLACLSCRAQHMRCDAEIPSCSRCRIEGNTCQYPTSRRGRTRRQNVLRPVVQDSQPILTDLFPEIFTSPVTGPTIPPQHLQAGREKPSASDAFHDDGLDCPHPFLSNYYAFFHPAHPCLVPKRIMEQYLINSRERLRPLRSVVCFIGSLFSPCSSSERLKTEVEQEITAVQKRGLAVSTHDVQAVLLYGIAVYWCDEISKAEELLQCAIRTAVFLGMNRRDFAVANGQHDRFLEESLRRTWWQIYVTDALFSGGLQTYPYRTSYVKMDACLPCEETCYESGEIPRPRTLAEYDMRDLMGDEKQGFSSFAELVGLARALDMALVPRTNADFSTADVVANVDAAVTAWSNLLPVSKNRLQQADGSFDEAIFQAKAVVSTYLVGLHRQLSFLAFSPIEAAAQCTALTTPGPSHPNCSPENHLHTTKVLRAIDDLDAILTIPTNIAAHSPFIICMVENVALARLAACRHVHEGYQVQLSRERIRLSMGLLKTLGNFWPLGERTYRELGRIARAILVLDESSMKENPHALSTSPSPQSPALLPSLPLLPSFVSCNLSEVGSPEAVESSRQ